MRLIDADALENKLHELALDEWNQKASTSWSNAFLEFEDMVYNAQTVESKHGRWDEEMGGYVCSICEGFSDFATNYCPYCGSKMEINEWEEPEINPCRGCIDYDGRGGCKSNGGCGR